MPPLVFDKSLGAITTMTPTAVPVGYLTSASNVDLSPHQLMKPRAGTAEVALAGTAYDEIVALFTDRISGSEVVWSFEDNAGEYRLRRDAVGAGAYNIALQNTPTEFSCCAFNKKVFIAFTNSYTGPPGPSTVVNRLHCYDTRETSAVLRKVGIGAVSAPTVANTGAGAYAATIRYYKVQMRIYLNADSTQPLVASSELSASTSFTPSGAGTAARITKPTTVDSATHWVVYASSDNLTFFQLSGAIAVGTTTYDDSAAVTSYNAGEAAPEAGLFVPPPSAKFLATNGERIFMAGSYEVSAIAGETTPSDYRVWFTRPLGVTDAGDDEAITQTELSRYYIDIHCEDGSKITALSASPDGDVYVGTSTSLWRLSDTGDANSPIRADRVVNGVGPSGLHCMTQSDSADGNMLYFASSQGPYRYSPATGLQYLGADWVVRSATSGLAYSNMAACHWDPLTRRVAFLYATDAAALHPVVRWFDPSLAGIVDGVWRGGWSVDTYAQTDLRIRCATVYNGKLLFGGNVTSSDPYLFTRSESATTDDGASYTSSVVTPDVILGDGSRNMRVDEPYLLKRRDLSVSVVASRNRGGTGNTVSDTAASESIGGGETAFHRLKIEGLAFADANSIAFELGVTTPVINAASRHTDGVDRLVVPIRPQELG